MKAQIEVEVKHASDGLYSVQAGGWRILVPNGVHYWTAKQLEAVGLPVPPDPPVIVEVALTQEEADDVERGWGSHNIESRGPLLRVRRKLADAVKKTRS